MSDKNSTQAFAYTPGLKIKTSMLVEKERKLPIQGKVFVKEGDKVTSNQIVAQATITGDPYLVDAATRLGIVAESLPELMVKQIGEEIKEGDLLCRYSMFFGLMKRDVLCPVNGQVESVSNVTGRIVIRTEPIPVNVQAYIPGIVKEVTPDEGAIIETNGAFIQGIFGISGEKHGIIRVVVKDPETILDANLINEAHKDCILIGGSLVTTEAINKAIKIGASGIVCGGINSEDVSKLLGQEIGVAITGEEELGLTLVITEGFGQLPMHHKTFEIFKKYEGYSSSINGETQIRAGVIRPEIIIPHEPEEHDVTEEALVGGMASGTQIRIIRDPYFGAIGKVVSLPVELQALASGSKVRVLEAELATGEKVIIPRANVEIIEE